MEKKKIIKIYPKSLKELFLEEWVAYRTWMNNKHKYACVLIAVGKRKPILDEDGKNILDKKWNPTFHPQKYRKRYLWSQITALLWASNIFK